MIVTTGLDYFNDVALGNVPKSNVYIGLFKGDYTPILTDTGATFPTAALELTTEYSEAARVRFIAGASSSGALDNTANMAVFTFASTVTVYGGALFTGATKGGIGDILIQATRFSIPRTYVAGDVLNLPWYLTLQNV